MTWITISVSLSIVVVVGAILFGISSFLGSLSSGCSNQTAKIDAAQAQLKSEVSKVTIDGSRPTSVTDNGNDDCVDGSPNVTASAHYTVTSSSVSSANNEVLQSLQASPSEQSAFIVGENDGDNQTITDLDSTISIPNSAVYKVRYTLQTPVTCQDMSGAAIACSNSSAELLQKYNLLQQPVSGLTVSISRSVDD